MNVEIFGKQNCPFCDKAKALLNIKQIEYDYIDFFALSQEEQDLILQERAIGAKTFPIILVDNVYVGGFTDIQAIIS
ncbi:glutaredoxin [Ochrobactrum phage vB_OspM_OC]|nr:glutaredoxin [Ochrobactrum phage vB_OspM_OC]